MLTRVHISLLLAVAVAIWAIVLTVRGVPVSSDLLIPYGIAVSAITILCVGFNRWCWRFTLFKGWLVQRPWLQGTWHVTLKSNYVDPKTGQQIEPVIGFMAIRQTFSHLSLRLFTRESASFSISSAVLSAEDDVFKLVASYQNEPSVELRGTKSAIHFGTLMLAVQGEPPHSLSGHYWTDRNTTGTIELRHRHKDVVSSFAQAESLRIGL